MSKNSKTTNSVTSTDVRNAPSAESPAATEATPKRSRPLRRWSVADLIARAIAPPRVDGMSH
jgi:hypothetical protein